MFFAKCVSDPSYPINRCLESNFRHREELNELLLVPFAVPILRRKPRSPMSEIINSRHTIVVVEDDDNARRSLTKNLRQLGYRLLVAVDWKTLLNG